MRTSKGIAAFAGIAAILYALGATPARAEEAAAEAAPEAPTDPTRGQWDSFLDGFRDFEDDYITGTQKKIEDETKVHVGAAFVEAYEWNFNRPPSGLNTFRSLDPYANNGQPNIGQLSLLRPSQGFIPGFGLKLDAGVVAKKIKADWNGDGAIDVGDTFEKNNFDAEEVYLQYNIADTGTPIDGLTIKGGKFVTTAGAEVIEPWLNYNFSRSFLFGLAIPFTHTGVIGTYPITDKLSVTAGGVAGWDNVADNNNSPSFLANVVWTITDQVSFAGTGIYGPEQNNNISHKRALGDIVLTVKPVEPLTLLLNYDYGHEEDASLSGGSATWQGFAAVGNYAFTDRFSVALRGEWFEDGGGSRTGTRQNLYEGTATAKYLITQHLYGQLEMRRDNGSKKTFEDDSTSGFTHGQTTVGFAVGWVFN